MEHGGGRGAVGAAAEGQATLRFYQWSAPTLSLGYFQAYTDRQGHRASLDCDVVRRQSGGGAILHDCELTYSLAVPEGHPLAVHRLRTYRVIHQTLIETLGRWGVEARLCDPGRDGFGCGETGQTPAAEARQPFLCFERRAPGDVLIGGVKIAGSAQRRSRGAVLQHGSVLLARSHAAPELDGLKELSGKALMVEEFMEAWLSRLSGTLGVAWRRDSLSEPVGRRAAELAAEKYASTAWTEMR